MSQIKKSDSGIFLWFTYHALKNMNVDVNSIFTEMLFSDQPPDKMIRRDNAAQRQFWEIAERISADRNIGLHVGENFPSFQGGILEYIFMSSATFGEGLRRALLYQKIFTDVFNFDLVITKKHAMITNIQHPVRHYLECVISIILNFLAYVSGQHFYPAEIWLPYPEGAPLEEYQRIWKCPVRMATEQGSIVFDAQFLDLPSHSAEPTLLKIHEHVAQQQMKNVDKYHLIQEIESILSSGLLEIGQANLKQVAQHLGLQPRKLRADLQDINTTFEKILANHRLKIAKKLLLNQHMSIDHIIYLLGFSEPSAFSRAFKRWTGETPSQYRQRQQKP